MANCCVLGCNNNTRNSKHSLHAFPRKDKYPKRYKIWKDRINRKYFVPNKNHVVCSAHFTKDDFESLLKQQLLPDEKIKRILKRTAVPSLLLNGANQDIKKRNSKHTGIKIVREIPEQNASDKEDIAIDVDAEASSEIRVTESGIVELKATEADGPSQQMSTTWCNYKGCMNKRKEAKFTNIKFYSLPYKETERCKEWIRRTGNNKLSKLKPHQCHGMFLCELHFEEKAFVNKTHHRLNRNALPKHFLGLASPEREVGVETINNPPSENFENSYLDDTPLKNLTPPLFRKANEPHRSYRRLERERAKSVEETPNDFDASMTDKIKTEDGVNSERSYGNWWKKSEGYQRDYRPQDADSLGAEDYITLEFESAVAPRDICIYEVYNPGAVVRIWGKLLCATKNCWILLWQGPPQDCPHKARKFHPRIKKTNHLINTIRLEINQSHLQYHYSIDAVLLGGCQPTTDLQYNMMLKGLVNQDQKKEAVKMLPVLQNCDKLSDSEDLFLNLPYEVIIHIFQYLDLKSLSRCAQVNQRWSEASADPVLYQSLSLRTYWHLVNCSTLEYFMNKCKSLKRLDLSWCGNDTEEFPDLVVMFLRKNYKSLTHLSLGNCKNINMEVLVEICACKELCDLRLKNISTALQPVVHGLNKLIALDLTASEIHDSDLIIILRENPNLKHIILDLCENLFRLDQVVETVVNYNKNLTTWSSWKTHSLTADGVKLFKYCPNIKELDLGWCLINKDPGDCMQYIAEGCRELKRLILSGWRGLNDHLLMSIILSCKELTQLDLLGIKNISADICDKALLLLPKLRLLDISFCDSIRQDEVEIWRQQYPHITIQRSCQYVVNDYLN